MTNFNPPNFLTDIEKKGQFGSTLENPNDPILPSTQTPEKFKFHNYPKKMKFSENSRTIENVSKKQKITDPSDFFANEIPLMNSGFNTNYGAGFPTNRVVNHQILMKSFATEFMNVQQKYHLIMVKKRAHKDCNSNVPNYYSMLDDAYEFGDRIRDVALNIPGWNYFYAKHEPYPSNRESVMTVNDVLELWTYGGVVRTEEGYKNVTSDETNKDRLLNNTVMGPITTFMGWQTPLPAGTSLYLLLKKMPVKGHFVVNGVTQEKRSLYDVERGPGNRSTCPFVLSFWASMEHKSPPDSVLKYDDEFGAVHRGVGIYVGLMQFASESHYSSNNSLNAATNISNLTAQSMGDIFVDY